MYCEVCCCLHIHSVVNVLVMGLVLGQSLMFISTTGILLYARVYPFIMYYGSALLLFTRKLHCLQIFEHISALLVIKAYVYAYKWLLVVCVVMKLCTHMLVNIIIVMATGHTPNQ